MDDWINLASAIDGLLNSEADSEAHNAFVAIVRTRFLALAEEHFEGHAPEGELNTCQALAAIRR